MSRPAETTAGKVRSVWRERWRSSLVPAIRYRGKLYRLAQESPHAREFKRRGVTKRHVDQQLGFMADMLVSLSRAKTLDSDKLRRQIGKMVERLRGMAFDRLED